MTPLIETVIRQAINTFTKMPSSSAFQEHFDNLLLSVNQLTVNDVKLDRSLLSSSNETPQDNRSKIKGGKYLEISSAAKAPVTYVEVFENADVTVGIFILRAGSKLPLHDHPLMYGILKVIIGQVSIQSYSLVKEPVVRNKLFDSCMSAQSSSMNCSGETSSSPDVENEDYLYRGSPILATKHSPTIVSETDACCVLTPTERNLHEILPHNGPAAFIDILAPPYYTRIPNVGPRECLYFIEIGYENNLVKLKRVPSPPNFWSDSAPYTGPLLPS